jgi:predicted unusual protein kinase regulating ubiquinone biosynthesis (AarF/ABC1/UbiB family)
MKQPAPRARIKKIKTSTWSRGFSLAKMTIGTATSLAAQGIRGALGGSSKESWESFLQGRAAKLADELGELKGSLMKAGQMLSMLGEHFLTPEANAFLKKLQSQSAFLEWPEMKKQLNRALEPKVISLLDIDEEPLAAASLGQVHRGTILASGESVAVKIQYPGVRKAIDSDLRALKTLSGLLKIFPREMPTEHLFAEVKEMLLQEADYAAEARQMETYRSLLGEDARYVIPKLYPELSAKRVLVTSFEQGVQADSPEVQDLSEERRRKLAESFLSLYFRELFEWGFVQTDPHLGNYKIRVGKKASEDKIILLDFGATRKYPDSFLVPYRSLLRGAFRGDRDLFLQSAYEVKFLDKDDPLELKEAFLEFCTCTLEPFLTEDKDGFDWKGSDLPYRLSQKVFRLIKAYGGRKPPREVLFLDRKTGGVFVFLTVLAARFPARKLILPYMADES